MEAEELGLSLHSFIRDDWVRPPLWRCSHLDEDSQSSWRGWRASEASVLSRRPLSDVHPFIQQVVGEHPLWVRACLGAVT